MAVTLFTVACGYVGARAIPELLLNNEWRENLETLQVPGNNLICPSGLIKRAELGSEGSPCP